MESFFRDTRFGWRFLVRDQSFTAAVVLIMSLGIGVNSAMFSLLDAAFLRPLPFEEAERLVVGRATKDGAIWTTVSAPDYYDYRERSDVFESLATILAGSLTVTVVAGGEPERVESTLVSWELFRTLGVESEIGRHFIAEEGEPRAPDVVMLSHGYWQRRYGGRTEVLGSTMLVEGRSHEVVGVLPSGFRFLHPTVEVWRPMRRGGEWADGRQYHNFRVIGRLAEGVTLEQAQGQIDAISGQLAEELPDTNRGKGMVLGELQEVLTHSFRLRLIVLMNAVGVVFLLACANVSTLLLARGSTRQTEISVRAALGASRARLIRQLLTEAVSIGIVSGGLGVIVAYQLRDLALGFLPLERLGITELGVDPRMLAFTLAVSLLASLLIGIVPALHGARADVAQHLRTGSIEMATRSVTRFRSALVVAQVALSVVLLVGSGLLIRTLVLLRTVDLGFDPRSLLTAEIPLDTGRYSQAMQRIQLFSDLLEDVRSVPGVSAAGLINQLPIRHPWNNIPVFAAGAPPADASSYPSAMQRAVFPGYFDTMGIPLLRGRDIEATDSIDSPPILVISRSMAEALFPGKNPLGRRVVVDPQNPVTAEVVGVVGDVRMNSLDSDPNLALYASYRQIPDAETMRIAVRTQGDPAAVAPAIRRALARRDKDIALAAVQDMRSVISDSLGDRRLLASVVTLFASIAVFQGMTGLYGLLAYTVSRRRREIAVRIALGAGARDVLQLIMSGGLRLVALGLGLGLVGGLGAGWLMRQMLFGVGLADPAAYSGATLLFASIALVACWLPAWRALRVSPAAILQGG